MSAEWSFGSRLEFRREFVRRSGASFATNDRNPTTGDRERRQQSQHAFAQYAANHHLQTFQLQVQELHQAKVFRREDKIQPAAYHKHGEAILVSRCADLCPARRWILLRPVNRRSVSVKASSEFHVGHRARHGAPSSHDIGQFQPFESAGMVASPQSHAPTADINRTMARTRCYVSLVRSFVRSNRRYVRYVLFFFFFLHRTAAHVQRITFSKRNDDVALGG